ncbi:leucine-rich repeat flightless-interacting protein 2 isoform X9 [Syngnathus typhle]|uniref:leucine-rich repeat flightless-interacting protein 2 isoform X9 n=1 Tax=Syngnathus typhle TaxID=161592 RepID=UPI002A6A44E4|nr:leucine-rich repeat flightless-interacting protein 2 isoform X9 [Syngnathus typhle]
MGTQGTGRKRAPLKDRFSAEDEALSSIAREAEARLAAKRAARAEARDIRMRELERQQKELSYRSSSSSSSRKWGQIHQWMADSEKARASSSSRSSSRHRGLDNDVMSVRSYRVRTLLTLKNQHLPKTVLLGNGLLNIFCSCSLWMYDDVYVLRLKSTSSDIRDLSSNKSRSSSRRKDILSDGVTNSSTLKSSRSTSSVYNDLHGHKRSSSSSSRRDLLTGLYHDQRKYTSLSKTKPEPPSTLSSYQPRRNSSDDDTTSSVSQERFKRGRRDSASSDFSDMSESAADYFSRSNRRGSIVSDLDDLSIPDLDALDEKCDKQYSDYSRPSSRCATPGLSAATLASLGGTSSRRGSADAGSVYDPDTSLSELRDIYELKDQIQDVEGRYMQGLKELKESLTEVEEKYKKAMVSNAQLDNDKGNLIYQVDTLKDVIEEMEEQMSEMKRELEEKSKELERQKHTCTVLQHKQEELKEGIRQRDELIEENQQLQAKLDAFTREMFDLQETINWKDKKIGALERQKEYFDCIRNERDELRHELADLKGKAKSGETHGLVIIPDGTPNGDIDHEPASSGITVVSQEAAQVLESAGEGPLDVRLRKLAEEKDELLTQIRKLKNQLEEERQKHSKVDSVYTDGEKMENGTDLHFIEMQRDANRQISEYKFKLSKAEQEMGTMEQNINRLEGQVSRYKMSADNSEKVEDELKAEKRKLQRELRTSLDKIEEMEMTNNHLVKRLEKMKANRNAFLSQQ